MLWFTSLYTVAFDLWPRSQETFWIFSFEKHSNIYGTKKVQKSLLESEMGVCANEYLFVLLGISLDENHYAETAQ